MPPRSRALPEDLRDQIQSCGFFPELVSDCLARALTGRQVRGFLVHHEAIFSDEIHRHLTVLVLTGDRLVVSHTDEGPTEDPPQAVTSIESVALARLGAISLTRLVTRPAGWPQRSELTETLLTLSWGTMRKLELEPAHCDDPQCEADHGYQGSQVAEDIVIRMSPAADGAPTLARLEDFADLLLQAVGERG